jgi:hypothetical protein
VIQAGLEGLQLGLEFGHLGLGILVAVERAGLHVDPGHADVDALLAVLRPVARVEPLQDDLLLVGLSPSLI